MMIKCLAIDDEPYALQLIVDYIEKTPFLELTDSCLNAIEAIEILAKKDADLIFVDINMPEMSGLDFVKSLNKKVKIIFTTAYSEYAVESYKVDAIDYLLKPITYKDFLRATNKVLNQITNSENSNNSNKINDHFFVKAEGKIQKIRLEDIKFVESLSEYVKIHLENNENVVCLMSLKNLEKKLPNDFLRVHRSYIVNLNKVTTIERNKIVFDNKVYIPVSEQYKDEFKKFLNRYFI